MARDVLGQSLTIEAASRDLVALRESLGLPKDDVGNRYGCLHTKSITESPVASQPMNYQATTSPYRWRIMLLVASAIAISYFDRQTLSVAIKAIQVDIPVTNTQFSQLQA